MSHLVTETIHDLHWGRQSWRVRLLLSIPALITAVTVVLWN